LAISNPLKPKMSSIESDLDFDKITEELEKSAINEFILTMTDEEAIELLLPGLTAKLPTMSDSQKTDAMRAQAAILTALREAQAELKSKLKREKSKSLGYWF
jgi:hypothetical protein